MIERPLVAALTRAKDRGSPRWFVALPSDKTRPEAAKPRSAGYTYAPYGGVVGDYFAGYRVEVKWQETIYK
jgi:hypothetical protein